MAASVADDVLKRVCAVVTIPTAYYASKDPRFAAYAVLPRYCAALYVGVLGAVASHACLATCYKRLYAGAVKPWKADAHSIHYERGLERFLERNYAKAIKHFTRAIESHPSEGLYYARRADSYLVTSELQLAYNDYVTASLLSPYDDDAKARVATCAAKFSSPPVYAPATPPPSRSFFRRFLRRHVPGTSTAKPWTATARDLVLMFALTIPVFLAVYAVVSIAVDTSLTLASFAGYCCRGVGRRAWRHVLHPTGVALAPLATTIFTLVGQSFEFLARQIVAILELVHGPFERMLAAIFRGVGRLFELLTHPLGFMRWLVTTPMTMALSLLNEVGRALNAAISPEIKRRVTSLASDLVKVALHCISGLWNVLVVVARVARQLVTLTYEVAVAVGLPTLVSSINQLVASLLGSVYHVVQSICGLVAELLQGVLGIFGSVMFHFK
ncbi:hypothetical protein SPRG_17920 [Saprolegnia parasitica CBS 223.65]|uniref:Uncharacterized protein n=1 Tax=Saprolegnia parasitica (strain CBS 223.65) TaxID=695850 RepID=A0A067BEL2_SAPPC|nr:hypothetical protein SPRG_17920 [Saprolegnia parasitica CBS 223.65]KDO16568.1 hypothetical protein SPRG_17920 [Saprolegnia parasitica CBS 223.65]|eukprot:XP_012212725.1 hypothetical protein SPRG_17920 [Saprolegnia parasitica CBS 223.65]